MVNKDESLNFSYLKEINPLFFQLAKNAELTFVSDPNTSLIKVRQLGEAIIQYIVNYYDLPRTDNATQIDLIHLVDREIGLDQNIRNLFHLVRKLGNSANHEFITSHGEALKGLRAAHAIAIWFYEAFNSGSKKIASKKFIAPKDPSEKYRILLQDKERLERELAQSRDDLSLKDQLYTAQESLQKEYEQLKFEMIHQAQEDKELIELYEHELQVLEKNYKSHVDTIKSFITQTEASSIRKRIMRLDNDILSEELTRMIIDSQLQKAGWEADTQLLKYSKGARPELNKNMAIAEWPLNNKYSADYVLFVGLTPIAVVEAKQKNIDVAGKIKQAERYSLNFKMDETLVPPYDLANQSKPWNVDGLTYFIPFVYSSNGRSYLKQLAEKSGTWFRDVRKGSNIAQANMSFHSPDGLFDLLKRDKELAEQRLNKESMSYLALRDYQERAVTAIEHAITNNQRNILVAMATGTGKTRTILALAYRLLKTETFKRILFIVDRSALGTQTHDVMKEYVLEQNQPLSSIYQIAELKTQLPDDAVRIQVATVQAMVHRLFINDQLLIPIDAYDCIIVDEAHRGYTLDQEMTEEEILFRDEKQYQSTYRRVLDYFDAVKIALTATPAKHTKDIFGYPVYIYSYRDAVIDGYLIDHDPPKRYETLLNKEGIHFDKGEEVLSISRETGEANLIELEDEMDFEVEAFNRTVINENFNRVICGELVKHDLDPFSEEKTLIFCATDLHADMVKRLLDEMFLELYGDDYNERSVMKITGKSDKVEALIRHFKNERYPNIAITVDLLSTGIDVPKICHIVFLRKVKSRILYEQMIGRATRKCDEIGKTVFKIYDPVDLYATLQTVSSMKPIVKNPDITMEQLYSELVAEYDEDSIDKIDGAKQKHLDDLLAQFNQKIMRVLKKVDKKADKNPQLREKLDELEEIWGVSPKELDRYLHKLGVKKATKFMLKHRNLLSEIKNLQKIVGSYANPIISEHDDELISVSESYGEGFDKPDDYLESFRDFIVNNINHDTALSIVVNRPSDLTRDDLKQIKKVLDERRYTISHLIRAWKSKTNEDIAASIIGFIRQAALGEVLIPYEDRVKKAMREVYKMHNWTISQKKWLERIEKQLINEIILDRDRIDEAFVNDGGSQRLDRELQNQLDDVLICIKDHLWIA